MEEEQIVAEIVPSSPKANVTSSLLWPMLPPPPPPPPSLPPSSQRCRVMEDILVEIAQPLVEADQVGDESGDGEWMDATDFADVVNPTEWDMLLTRGCGLRSAKDLTRDSLFVKFDPLVQKRELPGKVEPEINYSQYSHEPKINSNQSSHEPDVIVEDVNEIDSFEERLVQPNKENEHILVAKDDLKEIIQSREEHDENKIVEEMYEIVSFEERLTQSDNEHTLIAKDDLNEITEDILVEIAQPVVEAGEVGDESGDGEWMDATDFADVVNPTEWDMLLTRGCGLRSEKDLTRDSLFVKFDPLVQKRELPGKVEPEINSSQSSHERDVIVEDMNEIDSDSFDERFVQLKKESEHTNMEHEHTQVTKDGLNEIIQSSYRQEHDEDKIVEEMNEILSFEERLAQSKKDNENIKMETLVAKDDLGEMESAFAEVLLLYESGKVYQKNFEQNEKTLTTRISQLEKLLTRMDEKHQYTETKFEEMSERLKQDQEARLKILNNENYKLKASLKMSQLKVQKLENEIEHTVTSNTDLQKLFDEMIQKC